MTSSSRFAAFVSCLLVLPVAAGNGWSIWPKKEVAKPPKTKWPRVHSQGVTVSFALSDKKGESTASRATALASTRTNSSSRSSKMSLKSSLMNADDGQFKRHGRACGLYVWDAPSALLHKWCHHLLKDCVYEGRGGHKVGHMHTVVV